MTILDVPGVSNIRDLGRTPTVSGGRVREGVLWRSGNLSDATAEAIVHLQGRIAHIVDLRDAAEASHRPSVTTGIRTTHLPLFHGSVMSFFEADATLDDMYAHLINDGADRLVAAVRIIAQGEPTLVHCVVGKDRTGVLVALVLSAIGVADDVIVADYALTASQLSEQRNRAVRERILQHHPGARNAVAMATESPAEVMERLLADVQRRWGSAAEYLLAHGLAGEELAALKSALVDESHS